MTTENPGGNAYDAVLADLQAKRDQIDQAIALLQGLRGGGMPVAGSIATPANGIVETAGMFLGMSIADATKKLLGMRKTTMGNVAIYRELQAGGLVLSGKDPVNVVGSVLTRRFNEVGDVVKVGRGIWGLKEWYPGRTFKPASKGPVIGAGKPGMDSDEGPEEPPEANTPMEPNPDSIESLIGGHTAGVGEAKI